MCVFGCHNWPQYFKTEADVGYPDGINRHHIHMHRKCLDCGAEQTAMFHIPIAYVDALDEKGHRDHALKFNPPDISISNETRNAIFKALVTGRIYVRAALQNIKAIAPGDPVADKVKNDLDQFDIIAHLQFL